MANPTDQALLQPGNVVFDLFVDVFLDRSKSRHMDKHRGMAIALTPQITDRTGNEERVNCLFKCQRQTTFAVCQGHVAILVCVRHPAALAVFAGVICNGPEQGQPCCPPRRRLQAEDLCRAHITGGCRQVYDEGRREEVWTFLFGLSSFVNKNVCERRRGVSDIRRARESMQDLAGKTVDGGRLVLLVGRSVFPEYLLSRIDRSVIGFVIDQEEWQPLHNPASVLILSICDMMPNPAEQALQNRLVFLDDEQPGALFGRDP
ncbi:hypothetical protein D3C87_1312910 [compost metagenome]